MEKLIDRHPLRILLYTITLVLLVTYMVFLMNDMATTIKMYAFLIATFLWWLCDIIIMIKECEKKREADVDKII